MSIKNNAILHPCPTKENLHVVGVGTTATTELDLFATFGIKSKRSRARLTIRPSDEVFVVFGASGLAAPAAAAAVKGTDGVASRIPADGERGYTLRGEAPFVRVIATNAATRVEFELEAG